MDNMSTTREKQRNKAAADRHGTENGIDREPARDLAQSGRRLDRQIHANKQAYMYSNTIKCNTSARRDERRRSHAVLIAPNFAGLATTTYRAPPLKLETTHAFAQYACNRARARRRWQTMKPQTIMPSSSLQQRHTASPLGHGNTNIINTLAKQRCGVPVAELWPTKGITKN